MKTIFSLPIELPQPLKTGKLDILITDDELSGRISLKVLLDQEFWAHIGSIHFASSFEEAKKKVESIPFHLIFLDVNLKGISAFELLSFISAESRIVFVTAYSEFAIQALRSRAFDYLLKPVKPDELRHCLHRLIRELNFGNEESSLQIKSHGLTHIIPLAEILYLQGDGPYSTIIGTKEEYTTARTLKSFEEELSTHCVRIHKSFLVNRQYIKAYTREKLFLHNQQCLPVSRNGYKNLADR